MNLRSGFFKRVGNKVMLSFIVVTVMPVAVIAYYSKESSSSLFMEEAMSTHEQLLMTHSENIEQYFSTAKQDVIYLAQSQFLARYLEAVSLRNSAELESSFTVLGKEINRYAQARGGYYQQLAYVDELGQETVKSTQESGEHKSADREDMLNDNAVDYFKSATGIKRGEIYISRLHLNRTQGTLVKPLQPVVHYATPVYYPNGRRAGIILATVLAQPALDKLGSNLLVSDDGFYLYHSDAEKRWGGPRDLDSKESFATNHKVAWQTMQGQTTGSVMDDAGNHLATYKAIKIKGAKQTWWLVDHSLSMAGGGHHQSTGTMFVPLLMLVCIISLGIAYWARRSIVKPLTKLISVVHRVASGDQTARADISSGDELEELGLAFDQMVDERIATLAKMEAENEALNNSIIELMEATAKLSENDLSIHVPVREDITGVVADGLNKMIKGTNEVLHKIRNVAQEVAAASNTVKERSDSVIQLAQEERQVVEETLRALDKTAQAMQGVADLAQACSGAAEQASGTTEKALETVTGTVEGMNEIREIISETEKRIKRLGERSQEINSVVEIINNIAERTHVLALNASMQAAAAGDAGRGFAVVADEVQRLAENSRNSTSQIAALVHNIQTETSETMLTMNKTITQVVNGSELAELAGRQMRETQANTADLVQAVMKISDQAVAQSISINELRRDAAGIRRSTQLTGQQLEEQAETTDAMVGYAHDLQEAVQLFTLKVSA